jgi:hypothetical protein
MDAVEKLIYDAETISKIPKGARISTTREFIEIDGEYLGQSIIRALNRDNRDRAITVVCQRLDLLIAFSDAYLESRYLDPARDDSVAIERERRLVLIKRIHIALANSCDGLDALSETYRDDLNMQAGLLSIRKRVNDQISRLSKWLMERGEYSDPKVNRLYINIFGP